MEQSPYAIDMQNIVKKFGSVIANDHDSGCGAGGAVIVQNFTHNARIKVEKSSLTASSGNINYFLRIWSNAFRRF